MSIEYKKFYLKHFSIKLTDNELLQMVNRIDLLGIYALLFCFEFTANKIFASYPFLIFVTFSTSTDPQLFYFRFLENKYRR